VRASVKYRVIHRFKDKYPITLMCEFFKVSRSGYYYWARNFEKDDKDKWMAELIAICQDKSRKTYGFRRVRIWLLREYGLIVNHKAVLRIMHKYNLLSEVRRRRKYQQYSKALHRYDNVLNREFSAARPNQKWVTDITEFSLFGTKLYLSPILDLYNGEIISYNISDRPTFHQVMDMLDKAVVKIPDNTNLIFHSDQGWQYQMKKYQNRIHKKGIIQSMSRKGNCLDNSVMDNVFGLLKSEYLYLRDFDTLKHFVKNLEY